MYADDGLYFNGNFYPRPPRGGRPNCLRQSGLADQHFYPRPPRGGRLIQIDRDEIARVISIHALREEGDYTDSRPMLPGSHFYPRPPRGGRLLNVVLLSLLR